MKKILNKLIYYLKNIMLPILLVITIYIIMMMFQRLEKNPFGENFLEFIEVILPYIILIILLIVNYFLKQDEVRDNLFYNLVSFIVMLTISVFCYRSLCDKNMLMWHRYKYDINFTYFTDQLAPLKTTLYLLSFANVILIIKGYLKDKKDNQKEIKSNQEDIREEELKTKLKKTLDTFE